VSWERDGSSPENLRKKRSGGWGLGVSMAEVAKACEVNANVLHRWRREIQEFGGKAFASNGQRRVDENRVAELERIVGRQALEIDFLRRCLQHVEEQRKLQALNIRQRPKWRASRRAFFGPVPAGDLSCTVRQGRTLAFESWRSDSPPLALEQRLRTTPCQALRTCTESPRPPPESLATRKWIAPPCRYGTDFHRVPP